ncbi:MAG TPA: hypothetical protein VH723_03075 [Candidatus Limnocylindrales bacterium]
MTDALYERYKEALRRGHVATLRERLDAALVAYGEAAELAPERALPHISLAGILLRLRRPEEALAAYGNALERAPRDEAAQTGRAEALAVLGRRTEAADALDRLADQLEADGKLAEAAATVRRALELAESRTRRKHAETLAARIEGRAWSSAPATPEAPPKAPSPAGGPSRPSQPAASPSTAKAPSPSTVASPASAAPVTAPVTPPVAPPAAAPAPPAPRLSGATLAAQAEASLDAGDTTTARNRLLEAAAAHRAAGAIDAALDACYLALGLVPADPELHLTLAELYLDRGWRGPAADKILLLGRLIDFQRDGTIRERVCRIVAERFSDDPRLTELCA